MQFKNGVNWVDQSYVAMPQGDHVHVLRDHWWYINDQGQVALRVEVTPDGRQIGDPYPMCNANKEIVKRFFRAHPIEDATSYIKIPLAFVDFTPGHY